MARLWVGDPRTEGARAVGHLVTRVCTHWDTVGPHAFPRHVNPEPRLQWRACFDAPGDEDVYCDDPDAPAVSRGTTSTVLGGRALVLQWLDGAEAEAVRARHGW
ncbi:hypothetical protein LGQ04_07720 [Cellulosimicrobium marinum]|nr:hypothetical protein [Cellulosimicrobium marinum]